jgi:glyceraldehyde-3-phosphate dehydrogenase (NADP+)
MDARPDMLAVRDPDDGTVVGEVAVPGPDMIERVLSTAHAAWREGPAPTHDRADWLLAAAHAVLARQEELARLIATEGVKTIREARREVGRCAQTLRLGAEEARRLDGGFVTMDQVASGTGRIGFFERRGAGPVVGITPYNDPLNLVAHKIAPALAAGCPIIIKPHPQTPFSALRLAGILHGSGVPLPWLQVVPGGAAPAMQLAGDRRVRVVSFTGGRAGGAAVARQAAGKVLALELGGVGVVAVAADADLHTAATAIHSGAFFAAGQNCVHAQRIVAADGIHDALVERLTALARAVRLGPKQDEATDMGPCIDAAAAAALTARCTAATARGARLITGGRCAGSRLEPTWLCDVPADDPLLGEETFGPVSTIERVGDTEELLGRVAAAGDAINAGIFTDSLDTALRFWRVAPAAAAIVNDSTDFRIDAMPFGGIGEAGLGREGVRDAAEAMSEKRLMILSSPALMLRHGRGGGRA